MGFGDFGTDYDYVSRLIDGQMPGRDFFSIFPPLSGYSLLSFINLFGDHYLVVNIHLWFWWLINIVVSLGIMVVYNGVIEEIIIVAASVALITIPPNMHGVSFAYMASSLAGVSVLIYSLSIKNESLLLGFISGCFCGATILTKPNVGIGIAFGLFFISLFSSAYHIRLKNFLISVAMYLLVGTAVGIVVVILFLGLKNDYVEVLQNIFFGGSYIKGGFSSIILRTIPRLSTTIESWYRYIVEIAITIALLGGFYWLFIHIWNFNRQLLGNYNQNNKHRVLYSFWFLCMFVIILSVITLYPLVSLNRITKFFNDYYLVSLPFALWQLLYIIIFVGLFVILINGIINKEYINSPVSSFWMSVLALIFTISIVASGRHNSVFSVTLALPVLMVSYNNRKTMMFNYLIIIFVTLWTLSWSIAPNWRSTFGKLTELPQGTKFSGLYWPEGAPCRPNSYPLWSTSNVIFDINNNISNIINNKVVLWLTPGPGEIFGGKIYKYGIHGISSNNVPPWAEKKMGVNILNNPPDFIVCSDFNEWADSKWSFLRPEIIEPWLNMHYINIWNIKINNTTLYLWENRNLDR